MLYTNALAVDLSSMQSIKQLIDMTSQSMGRMSCLYAQFEVMQTTVVADGITNRYY
jgi:hypothetical protein